MLNLVPDETVVKKVFDTMGPRYAERHGGYTRIIKAGHRAGDGAPLVLMELVDRPETPKAKKEKGKEAKGEKAPRGKKAKEAVAAS